MKKGSILIEMLKYALQTLDPDLDPKPNPDPNTTRSLDPDPNSTNPDPKHCESELDRLCGSESEFHVKFASFVPI